MMTMNKLDIMEVLQEKHPEIDEQMINAWVWFAPLPVLCLDVEAIDDAFLKDFNNY